MSVYPLIARRVVFPIGDSLRGIPICKRLEELDRSQWWSRAELANYQDENLVKLIKHVYENVPYYRRVMQERKLHPDDIRSAADLPKLPVLTKDIARRENANLCATNFSMQQKSHAHTGGSTGEPLNFFHSKETRAVHQAAFRRGLRWGGLEWGETIVTVVGGLLGTARTSWAERIRRVLTRDHFLPAFEIRSDRIDRTYEWLGSIRPKALLGYTSSLYALARLCARTGKTSLHVPLTFSTAEVLFPFHTEQLKVAFGCEVYDYYGSGEVNSIAYQCPFRDGYHVTDEKVLLEAVKITDSPDHRSAEGMSSRLLVTDLTNWAFPFIRYENGDSVVMTDEPCQCGRQLSRIKKILGRLHDFILTTSGDLLAGEFFPHLFGFSHGVEQYQIIQDCVGKLRVLIVPAADFDKQQEEWLVGKIKEYAGEDMDVVMEHVEEIATTPAGKRRLTVSRLDQQQLLSVSGSVRRIEV